MAEPDLETLLMSPQGFGLETATPVQRAACRIIQGLPLAELWEDPTVQTTLGETPLAFTGHPHEFVLLAAIRSGKSLIASAAAVWMARTCDVSGLGHGEMPRVSVLSVRKDQAGAVLGHITGNVQASSNMSEWLVTDPTADSIIIRHPSGRPVEIKVVHGARAGSGLIARWCAGCIFDEAPPHGRRG